MDAINFLLNEHNKVRKMITEISKKTKRHETKKSQFNLLCQNLVRHETMEHKVWYPHLKSNKELEPIIKHLISEEKKAATVIKEFKKIKTEEEWEKKFQGFKKDVEHHAKEEETKLFPKVKKFLDEAELKAIGKKMASFKKSHPI